MDKYNRVNIKEDPTSYIVADTYGPALWKEFRAHVHVIKSKLMITLDLYYLTKYMDDSFGCFLFNDVIKKKFPILVIVICPTWELENQGVAKANTFPKSDANIRASVDALDNKKNMTLHYTIITCDKRQLE